jgi:hypothetical protein
MIAQRAARLFGVTLHQLSWLGKKLPSGLAPLRRARDLERSQNACQRLSLWYNGVLEACNTRKKIVSELIGAVPQASQSAQVVTRPLSLRTACRIR